MRLSAAGLAVAASCGALFRKALLSTAAGRCRWTLLVAALVCAGSQSFLLSSVFC